MFLPADVGNGLAMNRNLVHAPPLNGGAISVTSASTPGCLSISAGGLDPANALAAVLRQRWRRYRSNQRATRRLTPVIRLRRRRLVAGTGVRLISGAAGPTLGSGRVS
jgi:hypothetical protein